jgi:hypothetical protein
MAKDGLAARSGSTLSGGLSMDERNSGDIDVVPTRDGWVVRTRGQVRESFESHLDAINWACHLAKAEGEELVVHAVNWSGRDTPADQAA